MNRQGSTSWVLGLSVMAALAVVLMSPGSGDAAAWGAQQTLDEREGEAPRGEQGRERELNNCEIEPPGPAGDRPRPHPPRKGVDEDGRRHRPHGDRPPRGRGLGIHEEPPPPEMILLAMEVIREKLPDYYQRLQKLKRRRPEHFEQAIGRIMPVLMEYVNQREHNAELAETIIEEFKIEQRLRMLGRRFRAAAAEPEKQARIENEIVRLVNEQFEVRHRRHVARLEEFEQRLRRQQERMERERERFERELARRGELVAERVEEVKRGKMGEKTRDRMREKTWRRGRRPPGPDKEFSDRRPPGPRDDRAHPPGHRHQGTRPKPPLEEPED